MKNISIKVFDLAGQESMRSVWKYYFSSTEGIIFVIDANRHDRIADVKEEMFRILKDDTINQNRPVLIYANKQDLEGSMTAEDIIQNLELLDNSTCNPDSLIHVQPCSCKADGSTSGLEKGFEWLTDKIVKLNLAKPISQQA